MVTTLGVDVGGTKIVVGVVDEQGNVLASQKGFTPHADPSATVRAIVDAAAGLIDEFHVQAIGVGCAGWIDAKGEIVEHSPNLGWRDVPLRQLLQQQFSVPLLLDNDANVAAWAEYRFGAARPFSTRFSATPGVFRPDDQRVKPREFPKSEGGLLLLTVGTGLGGGIVFNDTVWRGAFGQAGEFGHMIVVPDGLLCLCGRRGCWEQYASGNALERFAREAAQEDPEGAKNLFELAGPELASFDGPEIAEAARKGDAVARAAFDELGYWLGLGMANLVAQWDPAMIVLGGGVAETGELLLKPTLSQFRRVLAEGKRHSNVAEVVTAQLGNSAGLIGAADLARRAFLAPQGTF